MMISTRGRYALRLLLDIAMHGNDSPVSMKELSGRQQISKKYGDQIAMQLCQAGILIPVRGRQGGYKLACKPDELTVLQILKTMEGPLVPVQCLETDHNLCERRDYCMTLSLWTGLSKVVADYLSGFTLQTLIDQAPPQPERENLNEISEQTSERFQDKANAYQEEKR